MAYTNPIQHLISLSYLLRLAICASQLAFGHCELGGGETNMIKRHESWMAKHGRVYEDMKEKERRYVIFMENVKFIEGFNEGTDKI